MIHQRTEVTGPSPTLTSGDRGAPRVTETRQALGEHFRCDRPNCRHMTARTPRPRLWEAPSKNSSVSHAEDARNGLPFQSMPCILCLTAELEPSTMRKERPQDGFLKMRSPKCTVYHAVKCVHRPVSTQHSKTHIVTVPGSPLVPHLVNLRHLKGQLFIFLSP